jgi:hypothetical protein
MFSYARDRPVLVAIAHSTVCSRRVLEHLRGSQSAQMADAVDVTHRVTTGEDARPLERMREASREGMHQVFGNRSPYTYRQTVKCRFAL